MVSNTPASERPPPSHTRHSRGSVLEAVPSVDSGGTQTGERIVVLVVARNQRMGWGGFEPRRDSRCSSRLLPIRVTNFADTDRSLRSRFVSSKMGWGGFEPPASSMSRRCHNQLDHQPALASIYTHPLQRGIIECFETESQCRLWVVGTVRSRAIRATRRLHSGDVAISNPSRGPDSLIWMYEVVHYNTKEFIGDPQCRNTSNA